jgi:5-methyltetrahydrofolate--homocysteine methyltransferase
VVMKENLEELNQRGLAKRWPVLLGGAALTRAYVEQDLGNLFEGEVRYARDAFEGLRLMDAAMAVKRGVPGAALPERRERRVRSATRVLDRPLDEVPARSDVAIDNVVPAPPFWGSRIVRGIPLAEYAGYLDERATFLGQWGLRGTRGAEGPSYDELVETEGRPRLRMWMDRILTEGIMEAAVVYGYWPCYSEGNVLVVLDPADHRELHRFEFPRQRRDRFLCLADFGRNAYRDYLELHGLSVQLTEALAEYWHARVRDELGFGGEDGDLDGMLRDQAYRGSRYSFGYPACPDLEDREKLVRLLEPERIGVHLSEELQLHPEQSTDALVVHHPEAKYFSA